MNAEPLISIVTVCLNSAEYIERCIISVLSQSYKNIEYIVIDGGSTDGTLDIIRKYEKRITYWISEKDRGIYDAMNKGIALCKGELIGLLNSDDYYANDAVAKIVDTVSADATVDVIHGDIVILNKDGNVYAKYIHDNLLAKMVIRHPTCFIKANIYKTYKYDVAIKISADYDLLLRLYLAGKNIKYVDHVITYFSPCGMSSNQSLALIIERFKIRYKYSLAVAFVSVIREALLYLDAMYYNYSINKTHTFSNHKHIYIVLSWIKKLIKPFLFNIRRRL